MNLDMRHLLKTGLSHLGYEIKRIGWNPYRIRKDFRIQTVIDVGVGVGKGTSILYEAFPDAKLLLVDPNPPSRQVMDDILTIRQGVGFSVAAGSEERKTTFFSNLEYAEQSSRAEGNFTKNNNQAIEIQMLPLDEIVARSELSGPYGLKIDVEGFELDVLHGAKKTLPNVAFVLLEAQLTGQTVHDKHSEIQAFLASFGFELSDIINVGYERARNLTIQADMLFSK